MLCKIMTYLFSCLLTCRTSGTLNVHTRGAHDLQKLKPDHQGLMMNPPLDSITCTPDDDSKDGKAEAQVFGTWMQICRSWSRPRRPRWRPGSQTSAAPGIDKNFAMILYLMIMMFMTMMFMILMMMMTNLCDISANQVLHDGLVLLLLLTCQSHLMLSKIR